MDKVDFFDEWFKRTIGQPLYEYQRDLLRRHAKKNVTNKSRQIGFSTFLAAYSLYNAVLGRNVMIISPSERQSMHVMEMVMSFVNTLPGKPEVAEITKRSIVFKRGGWVRSFPNSPNTVRGFTVHLLFKDEFAHFLNGTDRAIEEAVGPALTDDGEEWVVSTPFGENNRYYEIWHKDERYEKHLVNFRQCGKEEAKMREKCPDPIAFEQEYDNKFRGDVDTEFPWKLIETCVDADLTYDTGLQAGVLMGLDIGRRVDQTALVGCLTHNTKEGKKLYTVVYKNVMSGTEYESQQRFIDGLLNTNKMLRLNVDESGKGEQMGEHFKKVKPSVVNNYTFTAELKEKLVTNLKLLMVNGQLRLPDDAQLLHSIHGIQRIKSSSGHLKFDSDRTDLTGHSDTAWALMLALYDEKRAPLTFGMMKFG